MKFLIASDIHGSAFYTQLLVARLNAEGADRLLLLGDILYHGPRNELPRDYAPKQVTALLNPLAEKIISVRGNCESEVDQMVLAFPVLSDWATVFADETALYLTHGHHLQDTPVKFPPDSVIFSGHTHIPAVRKENDCLFCNPGSVSIPKDGSHHSYMTLEHRILTWKDIMTGEPYRTYKI